MKLFILACAAVLLAAIPPQFFELPMASVRTDTVAAGNVEEEEYSPCPMMPDQLIDPGINTEWNGKVYYFCCETCKEVFLANPELFAK